MVANFRRVLFLFTFLVVVNKIYCFPGLIPTINLVPNGLSYFTHRLNFIHPVHGIRKILFPEMNDPKQITLRPDQGQNTGEQSLPSYDPNIRRNIEAQNLNKSEEKDFFNDNNVIPSHNNNSNINSNIQNDEMDEKWNLFLNQYFNNQTSKSETDSIRNAEIYKIFEDIPKEKNMETMEETSESVTYTTDTTDTTNFDNETTTEDDLLRNGVPPEVLSSLLG